ncbi:MAG: hypothetical protein D6734_00300 [Candidatus Schekmanbacteria bacterium]|nr:MAG: hypothetical protein D6734_00300 [Candidatus Schekmanbacteria bacterium]
MQAPDVSLGVALYDYLPNIVFVIGIYFVISSIRRDINKFHYVLILIASVFVFLAGMSKATWKLIIAMADTDIRILGDIQFPLMGIGFFIIFYVLLMVLLKKGGGESSLNAIGIASSKKIFLPMMILGGLGTTICLILLSLRRKATAAVIFFALDVLMTTSMGYVGSKFNLTSNYAVFLEQTLNVSSRIIWAIGCYFLWKKSKPINASTS